MENYGIQRDSASWILFVKLSFVASVMAMLCGIYFLPTDFWVKGYMTMGMIFLIGSSITLSKTLRDEHEAQTLIKKISSAKTEKILKEYDQDIS
ncbi:MAG: hypothetical protein HQK77_09205 [Desulfobacterales bacterium]|nr:hypothetical protein [Desulfobacterales bacterium]